jgi:transglutaminase-like putative cysteine protease
LTSRAPLLAFCSVLCLRCMAPAQGRDVASRSRPESPEPEAASRRAEPRPVASASGTGNGAILGTGSDGFLSNIPTRVSDRAKALIATASDDEDFGRTLRVRLEVMRGYKEIGELTRRSKLPLVNGTFQITDLSRLGSRDTPTKADRASSFVIDHAEHSLTLPAAELEKAGSASDPGKIAIYVGDYIGEKSYARSFDVASRVATTRSGDCTEHAVLTAALLRRFGFDARMILGIVLVGVAGGKETPVLKAFGHAWVEHYDRGRWRIVDAALGGPECEATAAPSTVCGVPAGATRRLAYLPINAVKDESISFSRALMDEPGVDSILRVDVDVGTAN